MRRAESRGREPGEPEAERPKGGCLQDTPDITNAFSGPATQRNIQMETEAQRTIQMETEANGPIRWIPRSQKSKNDRKIVRPFLIANLHRHIPTQSSQLPSPPTPSCTTPRTTRGAPRLPRSPPPPSSVARCACVWVSEVAWHERHRGPRDKPPLPEHRTAQTSPLELRPFEFRVGFPRTMAIGGPMNSR